MKILVTGGAGYIGSFMVKRLLNEKADVIVVDNLERGHKEVIDSKVTFLEGDLKDEQFVDSVFRLNTFEGVVHFAGFISMGESMDNPYIYFKNNVLSSLNIVEAMAKYGSNNLIFSSTAGVYGMPSQIPILENHHKRPENPYGESKLMVEKILNWYQKTKDISFCALRYFNAAGASLDGEMGENHNPETHIIPNAIRSVLSNTQFTLFGNDYNTPDGTCIRDYIHVLDLVESHILAFNKLNSHPGAYEFNVGTGKGYSNLEVINMVKKVTGKEILIKNLPRRSGDADQLIANASKIKNELNFSPKYSDLQTIIESAWKWHSKNIVH